MFQLKPLSREGVDAALRKAERYRLLNEAWEAESICRDVLEVDPGSQQALVTLVLALTDQFLGEPPADPREAHAAVERLAGAYEREYYAGIVHERWAKRLLTRGAPGSGSVVFEGLRVAMECYTRAEGLRRPGDDDAVLRWNTCARLLMRHDHVRPAPEERVEPPQLE